MVDLRSTIRDIVAAPATFGAYPVTRVSSDGSLYEHSCSWTESFGFLLRRARYRDKFGADLPEWVAVLHPAKASALFWAALEQSTRGIAAAGAQTKKQSTKL